MMSSNTNAAPRLTRQRFMNSMRIKSRRSSIDADLDEESIHKICCNFSKQFYGHASCRTLSTCGMSDHEDSINSFAEGTFLEEEEAQQYQSLTIPQTTEESLSEDEAQQVPARIEVAPGVSLVLIGATETWGAIMDGRVMCTKCIDCDTELTCVDYVQLVICPDCQEISPVDQSEDSSFFSIDNEDDCQAVGMGFKQGDIMEGMTQQQSA